MKRLYDSVKWRKARKRYLMEHPLCAICERQGIDTPATIVDHICTHSGNHDIFWDENNWQPLCASCHSGVKRIADMHGYSQACDVDGLPIDAGHHWNERMK